GAAVKLLHQHLSASPTMLKRFAREVETLDKLRHPGIVNVLDMGELSTGRPWFAMEWLDGHDLREELRVRGPLSLSEVLAVSEDLCAALGAAHAAGIVHRDLKASNVMVVPTGESFVVRLVD